MQTYPDFLDDLSQWKDRTQAAATTSLSIVQIALLRDVIEGGPDKFQHYTSAVVVLSVCLGLEVLSGILLITLYILRSKSRMLSDSTARRHQAAKKQHLTVAAEVSEVDSGDGSRGRFARDVLYEHDIEDLLDDPSVLDEELRKFPRQCCGLYKPTLEILLTETIELFDRKIAATRLRHVALPDDISIEAERELQNLLSKKGILTEYLTNMNSRSAYNKIVKLQTVITYLFYILSLLNIFVAVFGVNQYDSPVNINTTCT